jgi:hypothetical protein
MIFPAYVGLNVRSDEPVSKYVLGQTLYCGAFRVDGNRLQANQFGYQFTLKEKSRGGSGFQLVSASDVPQNMRSDADGAKTIYFRQRIRDTSGAEAALESNRTNWPLDPTAPSARVAIKCGPDSGTMRDVLLSIAPWKDERASHHRC